ncbi:MAG: hypothetical protein MUC43_08015 [Pirellula sp.]|jgi:hypothetical protein|nr:hypothetical protein [Pirellula sp.]
MRARNGSEIVGFLKGLPLTLLVHFFSSPAKTIPPLGKFLIFGLFHLFLTASNPLANAGGTPGQWVVVVNGDSISSRTVANHFCQIRDIPANNVVVLTGIPDKDRITIDEFRTLILAPLMEELQKRGMANHIQGVAYSVDFPTSIDIATDAKKIPNLSQYLTPVASINGLTFFYRYVMTENPAYLSFDANWYARRSIQDTLQPLFENEKSKEIFLELDKAKDWRGMATLLSDQAAKLPKELRSPTHLLSAFLFAKAQDREPCLKQLESAILTGWNFRKAIENQPDLKFLDEDQEFQRLLKLCEDSATEVTEIRAFNARNFYSPSTTITKDQNYGNPFLLSVVLGVSRDLGLRREEVISGLRQSALADYKPLTEKIIFTQTSDVRTTTRQPFFAPAIDYLKKKGLEAIVHNGPLPPKGTKCGGLMMGSADFSLGREMIEFEPGAIAENLTSFGGAMTNPSQTKATEFLRYGAAITSGAVHEPYAIINKFPHPFIFDCYAEGLTSAESYYSSVTCPYQLLILGDPLCQPYAKPPRFTLSTASLIHDRNKPIKLEIKLDPNNESDPAVCWVTLDGRFVAEGAFRPTIALNLKSSPIGTHELRIGLKTADNIEHKFEAALEIQLTDGANAEVPPQWTCPEQFASFEKTEIPIELKGSFLKSDIQVWNRSELIATIPPDATSIPFSLLKWGYGPVEVQLKQADDSGSLLSYPTRIIEVQP